MPKFKVKQSNKTREYVNNFTPNHPGNQAFWGEALNDIPHPSEAGKTINYSQFKDYLKSPEMLKNPQYNDESKRNAYGEGVFKEAQSRFYKRADETPDRLTFPSSATDALNKPIDEFQAKHGDYIQSTKAYTPEIGTQRLNDIKNNQAKPLASYSKGTKGIKLKKNQLQKASQGLNDVAVPEAGNVGNVLSSGLSLAQTGGELGGPWGAVAGAALGVGMGFLQKSKQDKANRIAQLQNKVNKDNRQFDGVDTTINQKEQVFKKGTLKMQKSKLIEAEHNEHVFDKDLNHKGVVKGKSHEKGGEVIAVNEGDSIIPTKHKSKVDKALKAGDLKKIDAIRKTLPSDTKNGKAEDGVVIPDPIAYAKRNKKLRVASFPETGKPLFANSLNRKGQYGDYQGAVAGLNNGSSQYMNRGDKGNPYPYSVIKNQAGNMYKHNMDYSPLQPKNTLDSGLSTPITNKIPSPSIPQATNNEGAGVIDTPQTNDPTQANGLGNPMKYANIVNNTIRGLSTPKGIDQSYLNPDLLKYTDRSESLRRDSRGAESVATSNARNLSGGMVSNARTNQVAAGTDNLNRQDSINEREMERSDVVDNTNIGIKNNAKQINLGRKDMYADQLQKQRAVQESYINAATQEGTQLAETNEAANYMKSRDAKLDNLEQQKLGFLNQVTKYKANMNNTSINWRDGEGPSGMSSTPTTSSTTRVNEKGKSSTSTTTKSPSFSTKSLFKRNRR
jgi:hypothetical protein